MIDEMYRGTAGTMPAAPFADIYASAWDDWHCVRAGTGGAPTAAVLAAGGLNSKAVLDEKGKEVLAQLVTFAKPHFRV